MRFSNTFSRSRTKPRSGLGALFGFFCLIWLATSGVAFSQSPSLYGASIEESAILARFINVSSGEVNIRLGAFRFRSSEAGQLSAYRPITQDIYILRHGGTNFEFIPETNSFYSIVVSDQGIAFIKDLEHADPLRAQIVAYNLTSNRQAALQTTAGQRIFEPLAPGSSANLSVNAIAVQFEFFENGVTLGSEIALALTRGKSYSIILYSSAAGLQSLAVEATLSTQ